MGCHQRVEGNGTRNRARLHFWTTFWRAGAPEPLVKAQSAEGVLMPDPAWSPLSGVSGVRGALPRPTPALPHPAGRQVLLSRLLQHPLSIAAPRPGCPSCPGAARRVMERAGGSGGGTAQFGRALHPSARLPFCSVLRGHASPGTAAAMGAGGVNRTRATHR